MILKSFLSNLIIISCVLLLGCDEIFDEELEGKDVELYSPYNGAILDDTEVTFWWSEIEEARGYHLLVVKPDFDRIEKIVLDTVLTEERFDYNISQGTYQWHVRIFNNTDEIYSDNFVFEVKGTSQ